MIRQKSENDIVPEANRKISQTEENHSPKGGKVVSVNKKWNLNGLISANADKSSENLDSSATRGDDQSSHSNRRGAASKDHEKKETTTTMEELITLLRPAFAKVARNKGAPGPDKQTIDDIRRDFDRILPQLSEDLLREKYVPGNIRRAYIPKGIKGKRGLGIPNVIDRIVQEALRQLVEPLYEPTFHSSSHGFRPNKGCHTAIREAVSYIEEGREWVADIDLERYFDTVNHDRLLSKLRERIQDHRILRLIRKMLKAKVIMPNGVVINVTEGVSQGSPLSPLLSNIILDELDRELTKRGHTFVRYADDCNIYVKSERAGHRVMESITHFIEKRLRLKVNREKSSVSKTGDRHFLGFRLQRGPLDGEVKILLSTRSKKRIANRIKELTPRNWGGKLENCIKRLNQYLKGWSSYFHICTKSWEFETIDSHIRRRLRCLILKQWKRKRTIARKLIARGVNRKTAWRRIYMGSRSLWSLSIDIVVHKGLPNRYFAKEGLCSLEELWETKTIEVSI